MVERPEDLNLPIAVISRIIKDSVSKAYVYVKPAKTHDTAW